MKTIRAIDLCGGAGGWATAARGLPIRIEVAIDWDLNCCRTYKANHPETEVIRADGRRIPIAPEGFDLVLGGIPCQWLVKGLRSKVFNNAPTEEEITRETELIGALLDWTNRCDPRWWCFEDVVWLSPHLPLFTPQRVINAARFSGQRRKRLYVGVFPDPVPNGKAGLRARDYMRPGPYRINPRLLSRKPGTHQHYGNDKTFYRIDGHKKWPTVISVGSRYDIRHSIADDRLPLGWRQVEWQEAAVAQGFPEDYLFVGSQEAVARQVANAVQVDTARAILEAVVRAHGA